MAKSKSGDPKAEKPATKKTRAKKTPTKKKAPARPSVEQFQAEVKAQAHEIFLERLAQGREGDELSDWLQAEEKVKKTHGL